MHQVQTDFRCFLGKNKILCHDFSQSQLSVWPSFPSEKHVAEQYAFDLQGAPWNYDHPCTKFYTIHTTSVGLGFLLHVLMIPVLALCPCAFFHENAASAMFHSCMLLYTIHTIVAGLGFLLHVVTIPVVVVSPCAFFLVNAASTNFHSCTLLYTIHNIEAGLLSLLHISY